VGSRDLLLPVVVIEVKRVLGRRKETGGRHVFVGESNKKSKEKGFGARFKGKEISEGFGP